MSHVGCGEYKVLDILVYISLCLCVVSWHVYAEDVGAGVGGWQGSVDQVACEVWQYLHIFYFGSIVVFDEGYDSSGSPFFWGFAAVVQVVLGVVSFDLFEVMVHA